MNNKKKTAVIIAAAGTGKRMGSSIPKQYLKIGGEPILLKSVRAFCDNKEIDWIVVVTNGDYIQACLEMKDRYGLDKIQAVIEGGEERQDSVYRAIVEIDRLCPEIEYVLVHDGARPFVRQETINAVLEAAEEKGAAVACVPVKDSIRQEKDGESANLPRQRLYAVQTPQGFQKEILRKAYEQAFADGYYGTDDATLAERIGQSVALVRGTYDNIKITTREDMPMESRVGTGFDVHQLKEGLPLVLGGVKIPFEKGLLGHSDADVLVHALMDALLGAAALGDIGRHFPDTDPQYRGISSMELLRRVKGLLDKNGWRVGNVDITLMAQRPKIKSLIGDMTDNLSKTLDLETCRINIKGTTTERLGFVGREEGIAAQAVCLLYR
ncbi:2-C-methyl-D-erythritol 4-phosphate cytidylyltransferase [Zhenpiania hominis]|uniref:Bifunctional enzyme IspD/IspF n=1 Tax=Zhenpiania hominis TaxID=2763644 RepID=A0A923SWT2_9FIRM|nr:2-C-methyl-D-erythritol 4-phosphate cytidylyltransferase [Zhenpiania hominis]MBC6680638.1 2-C-methyl-D-erythritol 2,4-cyclodiphosphate synthase [Zhenpiania hominis]